MTDFENAVNNLKNCNPNQTVDAIFRIFHSIEKMNYGELRATWNTLIFIQRNTDGANNLEKIKDSVFYTMVARCNDLEFWDMGFTYKHHIFKRRFMYVVFQEEADQLKYSKLLPNYNPAIVKTIETLKSIFKKIRIPKFSFS